MKKDVTIEIIHLTNLKKTNSKAAITELQWHTSLTSSNTLVFESCSRIIFIKNHFKAQSKVQETKQHEILVNNHMCSLLKLSHLECQFFFIETHEQCPGRLLSMIGQNPTESKFIWLHVGIFLFFFVNLKYIQ